VWWKVGAAKLQGDLTLNWGGIEVRGLWRRGSGEGVVGEGRGVGGLWVWWKRTAQLCKQLWSGGGKAAGRPNTQLGRH
jgi:hypothetical protein